MDETQYFQRAIELSKEAFLAGNDGFGCVLVGPNGDILLEQGNAVAEEKDPTAHDAMTLIRKAAKQFTPATLAGSTIYATMEPCVMCMAAAFWAGLSNVKYIISEEDMESILPGGLQIHSQEFCARSPKPMASQGSLASSPLYNEAFAVLQAWVNKILGK